MRKIASILLMFIVSLGSSYQTLAILSGSPEKHLVWEEASSESEEQRTEKDCDDDQFFNLKHFHKVSISKALRSSHLDLNFTFSSADYSSEIYSPPESILLI